MIKIVANIEKLRKTRVLCGYSATKLSKMVGVSRYAISKVECSKQNPSPNMARKISDVLGVEFEELFTIQDSKCEL